jgi:hypothetical protein
MIEFGNGIQTDLQFVKGIELLKRNEGIGLTR